jgi:hypothetical protein
MKIMVCVAGLPHEVVEELHRLSPAMLTEDKTNPPIARPVIPPYMYRDGMSDAYHAELAKRLKELAPREDAAIILAYVAYEGTATSRFVRCFFPFAVTAPLKPFYPLRSPKQVRRHELRDYVDHVKEVIKQLRAHIRVVRDVFSGQNFTPLLLPLSNFRSDVLTPQITTLFHALGTAADPRRELDVSRHAILAHHPLQKLEGHTPYFQDDRKLRFKSPGRDRHGMARSSRDGHQNRCLINSRVRLGGPFDALFHYDCEYERGGVGRIYPNCHGADTEPAARTHVNIAPNDAIR